MTAILVFRLAKGFLALWSMFLMYFCALSFLLIILPRYVKLPTHSSVSLAAVWGEVELKLLELLNVENKSWLYYGAALFVIFTSHDNWWRNGRQISSRNVLWRYIKSHDEITNCNGLWRIFQRPKIKKWRLILKN